MRFLKVGRKAVGLKYLLNGILASLFFIFLYRKKS